MKTGLVLSGGGARGAYEAGVLRYIAAELAPRLDEPPGLEIVSGASVGALNGSWYAAHGWDAPAAAELSKLWQELETHHVFRFDARDLFRSPVLLFRQSRSRARQAALFDAQPFSELMREIFPWVALDRRRRSGALHALSVSATEVATGRHVQFLDHRGEAGFVPDPAAALVPVKMRAEHCLASAAIPFIFPPVDIDGRRFVDGSLRQNTPLTPALRLGAERLLVVGVKRKFDATSQAALERAPADMHPVYLLGKALDAMLLDPIEQNLHQLQQLNALLEWGEAEYGADFTDRLNAFIEPLRGASYRKVRAIMIQPREDLGAVAAVSFRELRARLSRPTRVLLSLIADREAEDEADLLSYLLFDKGYTAEIERLGWEDARDSAETLADFFQKAPGDFPLDNPWA